MRIAVSILRQEPRSYVCVGTNLVKPGRKTIGGVISFPVSSMAFLMSKRATMLAMASQRLGSARAWPGQILLGGNEDVRQNDIPGVHYGVGG